MASSFGILKVKLGYDVSYLAQFDGYTFDHAAQVAELIKYLVEARLWWLLGQLFKLPLNLGALKTHPDYQFYHALASSSTALLDYLSALSIRDKSTYLNHHHLCLSYNIGGTPALNELLLEPLTAQSKHMGGQLFEWAAQNGQLILTNYLLDKIGIKNLQSDTDNKALYAAAENRQIALVNRLLEIPFVRQACMIHADAKVQAIIMNGIKRALWLELQNTPKFRHIHHFEDLDNHAYRHLESTSTIASNSAFGFSALLASLKIQILSLRSLDPLNVLGFKVSAPVKSRLERQLGKDITSVISAYLGLPFNLRHFQEMKPLKVVAERCLRQWSLDAHIKRKAKHDTSDNTWRKLFLIELRGRQG